MSIRRIQLNRVLEKIIRHYLNYGKYPGFQTITYHLSSWLRRNKLGAPSFKFHPLQKREESSSKKFNQEIEAIHTDLSDAYQSTIEHTNTSLKNFEYIEIERDKLRHELALLEKDINKLLMIESNVDHRYFEGEIISFENAENVDQTKSNVHLDLKKQVVSLKEMLKSSSQIQIDPSKVYFETLMPHSKTAALESISRAFDQNSNTAWWQVVKTKTPGSIQSEKSQGMRAHLIVPFDGPKLLNEIRYVSHHGSPTYIKVEYSTDNTSFHPIPGEQNYRIVTSAEVWEFSPIPATAVRFVFEKKEHEDRSAGQYQFYFGAKEISFYEKRYEEEGVLYTNPIEFSNPIRIASIETNDHIPLNTSIDYEVALFNPNRQTEELTWQPLKSIENSMNTNKYAEFSNKYIRTMNFGNAEEAGRIVNGMHVFRLVRDNGDPIISEIVTDAGVGKTEETFDRIKQAQLFRGINQWKREQAYVPFTGEIPLNHMWTDLYNEDPEKILTDYLEISNTLTLKDKESPAHTNFFRFTTCVYTNEKIVNPFSLSMIKTLPNGIRTRIGTYSVYVNQKRQKIINDEFTLKLEAGWNEISILYHLGNVQERRDFPTNQLAEETYIGKFNFRVQQKIRAELKPMTYIDFHELFYNVSPNNRDYFSIDERQIILNYLPKNCMFQFKYEADVDDSLLSHHLILRAILKREKNSVNMTPTIKNINIRVR